MPHMKSRTLKTVIGMVLIAGPMAFAIILKANGMTTFQQHKMIERLQAIIMRSENVKSMNTNNRQHILQRLEEMKRKLYGAWVRA